MKTTKKELINVNPTGIDWEKEDVVLKTPSIVRRSNKGGKLNFSADEEERNEFYSKLSPHFIEVCQGYYNVGSEISFVNDDYISIRQFRAGYELFGKVQKFENAVANGNKLWIQNNGDQLKDYYLREKEYPYINKQTRIYKDRSVVNVYEIEWKNGEKSYHCFKPSYHKQAYVIGAIGKLGENRNDEGNTEKLAHEKDGESTFVEVFNDADIKQCALQCSNKCRIERFIETVGATLETTRGKAFMNYVGGLSYERHSEKFSEDLRNKVNEFFKFFDEENKNIHDIYYEKNKSFAYWEKDQGLCSLTHLGKFLELNNKLLKIKEKQQDVVKEIWPTINWPEVAKGERGTTWERRDDKIICAFINKLNDETTQVALIYNVTKRTSKLIIKDRYHSNPQIKIPTIQTIKQYIDLDAKQVTTRGVEFKELSKVRCEIKGEVKNFTEIFKKTNVGWIMENMKELGDEYKFVSVTHSYYGKNNVYLLKDELNEENVGNIAIMALVTTGTPFLEQLLKTKQFNLYFAAICDKVDKNNIFIQADKERDSYWSDSNIVYDAKQKSLKKMLGMTMPQIQYLNDMVTTKDEDNYSLPVMSTNTKRALGVENFADIDIETFKQIITQTNETRSVRYWAEINRTFTDVLRPMSVKERLEYLNKYCPTVESIEIYKDYLRMRGQLKALQERGEPGEVIFDENIYPEKVEKSKRFIRFTPEMLDRTRFWATPMRTEEEFINYINRRYSRSSRDRQIKYVRDAETGALVGVNINMDAHAHMCFLHDEMSEWFALYKDAKEIEGFKEALKRVKPLEWEDEKSGLCAIAPMSPGEVRKEGQVLNHCVASYVTPIIKGTENIMFIRRKDMVGEPFFTVDISPKGDIRQVHCYRNGNPDAAGIAKAYAETGREVYNTKADIVAFMKKWAKAKKGKLNEESIKNSYGALCANRA